MSHYIPSVTFSHIFLMIPSLDWRLISQVQFFIKDTSSSSGTFLNHMRLSHAGVESRAFQLKDGDILQLGVDYQGGTEEIYRCVKIRVEMGRECQAQPQNFKWGHPGLSVYGKRTYAH